MLPLAAYLAGRPHASPIVYSFAAAVYGIGSIVCHQRPERSFHLFAVQMPVCARCTGIYAGAAVAALVLFGPARRPRAARGLADGQAGRHPANASRAPSASAAPVGIRGSDEPLRPRPERATSVRGLAAVFGGPRLALFLALSPTIATLSYEWAIGLTPANWIRAVAGVPLGAVVSWLVVRYAHDASASC